MVFINGFEIIYSKIIKILPEIHPFADSVWVPFQHYSSVEAIRNAHIDKEALLLFSISEFSIFFAKLKLNVFEKHHLFYIIEEKHDER